MINSKPRVLNFFPPNSAPPMQFGIYHQLSFTRVGSQLFSSYCCHQGFVCVFEEESQKKQLSLPKNISLSSSRISQGYIIELWVLHSA